MSGVSMVAAVLGICSSIGFFCNQTDAVNQVIRYGKLEPGYLAEYYNRVVWTVACTIIIGISAFVMGVYYG
jgi:hypothetical protein